MREFNDLEDEYAQSVRQCAIIKGHLDTLGDQELHSQRELRRLRAMVKRLQQPNIQLVDHHVAIHRLRSQTATTSSPKPVLDALSGDSSSSSAAASDDGDVSMRAVVGAAVHQDFRSTTTQDEYRSEPNLWETEVVEDVMVRSARTQASQSGGKVFSVSSTHMQQRSTEALRPLQSQPSSIVRPSLTLKWTQAQIEQMQQATM